MADTRTNEGMRNDVVDRSEKKRASIPAMKGYRSWTLDQEYLLPPSPREWLSASHLVYFLLDAVEEVDLSEIENALQEKDPRGTRPYDPRMMVALLLYGYCTGIASSRKLEAATYTDVAFRVLCREHHPDHTSISEFRRVHLQRLSGLFVEVLRLCQKAGLVKLGQVALDGTKVAANASKHKAMSYERMGKTEAQLAEEVRQLLEKAEEVDTKEDRKYGKDKTGDELPEELARRESRLRKIREAKAALEAEAAESRAAELADRAQRAQEKAEAQEGERHEQAEREAAQAKEKAEAAKAKAKEKAEQRVAATAQAATAAAVKATTSGGKRAAAASRQAHEAAVKHLAKVEGASPRGAEATKLPEHRVACDASGDPAPKAQRNFTDPDSRIMKLGNDYVQGYNCQAAVSEGHQVIVAQGVSNQAPDVEHLPPMLARIEEGCGAPPERLIADAGYWSAAHVQHCEARGVDPYIATHREKQGEGRKAPPSDKAAGSEAKRKMREKLESEQGRAIYARRKAVVEPVFGQIKEARGFRRFLMRGIEKVRGEWALICTTHNLLKLFRAALRSDAGLALAPTG